MLAPKLQPTSRPKTPPTRNYCRDALQDSNRTRRSCLLQRSISQSQWENWLGFAPTLQCMNMVRCPGCLHCWQSGFIDGIDSLGNSGKGPLLACDLRLVPFPPRSSHTYRPSPTQSVSFEPCGCKDTEEDNHTINHGDYIALAGRASHTCSIRILPRLVQYFLAPAAELPRAPAGRCHVRLEGLQGGYQRGDACPGAFSSSQKIRYGAPSTILLADT